MSATSVDMTGVGGAPPPKAHTTTYNHHHPTPPDTHTSGVVWWVAAAITCTGAFALICVLARALRLPHITAFCCRFGSLLQPATSHSPLLYQSAVYGERTDDHGMPEHAARTAVWSLAWAEVGLFVLAFVGTLLDCYWPRKQQLLHQPSDAVLGAWPNVAENQPHAEVHGAWLNGVKEWLVLFASDCPCDPVHLAPLQAVNYGQVRW